jgi:hypothetical protein
MDGGDGDHGGWTWARGHDDGMTGKGSGGEVRMRTMVTKELGESPDYYDNNNEDKLPPTLSSRMRLVRER